MKQGMHVAVQDLTVKISLKGGESKHLLHGITFGVEPGDVVALMGPSGAGKTTMLNRLVGRGFSGEVAGRITYSGRDLAQVRGAIGYVTQDDIMYQTLTPRENLNYTAKFLQRGASAQERKEAVSEVIEKLRLVKCADTVVGEPGLVKGISGGERKRTNVAMSLLGNPRLLLLDEPTSGLDATMASELMTDVGAIARQGCTVIATIHQPSEAVFEAFTKVLLLDAGKIAYYGPVPGLRQRLQSLGFNTPEQMPLPEILLDVLESRGTDAGEQAEHQERLEKWKAESNLAVPTIDPSPGGSETGSMTTLRLGFCAQFVVLLSRTMLALRRNRTLTLVRAVQSLASSLLIGQIFVQLDNDLKSVNQRFFAAFLLVFAQFLFALLGVVNTFTAERAIFLREAQDRWYHPAAFYLAKVVVDTMVQSVFPVIVLSAYFIIGLNTASAERVLFFFLGLVLCANCGSALGMIVSGSVRDVTTALSIAPGMVMPQIILSGVFIAPNDLPQPFRSVSFLAVARYALQLTVINEFTCETDTACDASWRGHQGDNCENSPCNFCCTAEDIKVSGGVCPVLTCEDALRFIRLHPDNMWPAGNSGNETIAYNIGALAVLLLVLRLMGLVALLLSYRRAAKSG